MGSVLLRRRLFRPIEIITAGQLEVAWAGLEVDPVPLCFQLHVCLIRDRRFPHHLPRRWLLLAVDLVASPAAPPVYLLEPNQILHRHQPIPLSVAPLYSL